MIITSLLFLEMTWSTKIAVPPLVAYFNHINRTLQTQVLFLVWYYDWLLILYVWGCLRIMNDWAGSVRCRGRDRGNYSEVLQWVMVWRTCRKWFVFPVVLWDWAVCNSRSEYNSSWFIRMVELQLLCRKLCGVGTLGWI